MATPVDFISQLLANFQVRDVREALSGASELPVIMGSEWDRGREIVTNLRNWIGPRGSVELLDRIVRGREFGDNPVRAGTGIFLLRMQPGKIWLGRRKGAHGTGEWALPGGKPELYENIEASAAREVLEETGCIVNPDHLVKLTWTNDIYRDFALHYVTFYYVATSWTGTPRVMEPNKCEEWREFDIHDLPEPIMQGLRDAVKVLASRYDVPSE